MYKMLSKSISYRTIFWGALKRSMSTNKSGENLPVQLAYNYFMPEKPVENETPIIILHGLLGSKENWNSLASKLALSCNREVYALDARNHGKSPHTDEFGYMLMVEDTLAFMQKKNIPCTNVIGHSMGGRTAMMMALLHEEAVNKLVVVDMTPFAFPESSKVLPGYIWAMRDGLRNVKKLKPPPSLSEARSMLNTYLLNFVPELGLRQFLLSNLVGDEEDLKWKPNLYVLETKYFSDVATFSAPVGCMFNRPTLFISGSNSNYVRESDHSAIKGLFPKATYCVIQEAGHWVHAEKPKEFVAAVQNFL